MSSDGAARRRAAWWWDPLAGLVVTMVVTVPTLVVAENWHGRPLIDEDGAWWLLPAAIVVAGFLAGGAVAARRRSGRGGWAVAGLAVAVPAIVLLLGADGVRRALDNPTLPAGVVDYWLEGAAVALVATLLGAASGSRRAQRARRLRRPAASVPVEPVGRGSGR